MLGVAWWGIFLFCNLFLLLVPETQKNTLWKTKKTNLFIPLVK